MHSGGVKNIFPIGIAGRIYFIMPDGKILIEEKYKKRHLGKPRKRS